MKITIDLEILKTFNLTANEYVYLYLLVNNSNLINTMDFSSVITRLQQKYVIIDGSINYDKIPIELQISHNYNFWEDFKSKYPKTDGSRRLHDQQENCKKKYLSLIRNLNQHKEVINGLENEILLRKQAESYREFFPAWKLMSTYINQKHWLTYQERDTPKFNSNSPMI
jgi:hypothetical protein